MPDSTSKMYSDHLLRDAPAYLLRADVLLCLVTALLSSTPVLPSSGGYVEGPLGYSVEPLTLLYLLMCVKFFLRFMCPAGVLLIGCRLADGLCLGPTKFFLGKLLSIMKTVVLPWLMRRPTIRCSACL